MSTQPGVGRIVHYVARGSADGVFPPACRAAVVTETNTSDTVGLCVLNPTGVFFDRTITYDAGRTVPSERADGLGAGPATQLCDGLERRGGTWHWPVRT